MGESLSNTPDDGASGGSGKKRTGNLGDRKPYCIEAEILVRLDHVNCVDLYQTIDTAQRIHVIIEYVDGGTLDKFCKMYEDRKLEESVAAVVFAQLVAALEHIHARSICHRDVKLDNVLMYKDSNEVRLADFGLGEFVEKVWQELQSGALATAATPTNRICALDQGKKLKLLCGTPAYVAPEIVENKPYATCAIPTRLVR